MRKVLLAVDGSEHSNQATRFLVKFVQEHGPVEIHVANVEPAPIGWQTHSMEDKAINVHLATLAHQVMKSAQDLLKAAEIPHHTHFKKGDAAEALTALAKDLGCDCIVMGNRGLGAVSGLALGSVTTSVLHLTDLPVVCVK
jgi:nucleotide-binding universal stress UspA family protein